jgi:trimethylamine--corrinoid protein Co-methyltransferase
MDTYSGGTYKLLTLEDLRMIHDASLELLIEIGIIVHSDKIFNLFKKTSAITDSENRVVKIPYGVVQESLRTAPSEVTLYGREDRYNLHLDGHNVYMGTGGVAINVIDLYTDERRKALLKDVRNISRLVDALEHVHFNLVPVYPNNLPLNEVDVNRFFGSIANTTKHVMGGVFTWRGLKQVIRMAEFIAGSKEQLIKKPFISFVSCVMSPLKVDKFYGDVLVEVTRYGLPIAVPAEPLTGLTSPITLAGTLAGLHAETMAKIVIAQLVNPGTPIIYGCTASTTDPWTMRYITGSVEMGLINAGAAQLARYCNLPNYTTSGMSDSKVIDAQNGYEKAITSLMVALSGSDFIHDSAGLIEFALTASYKQYVIDNEINGMVMRALKGIEVSEETLALDVFRRVGPGGNFVTQKHTSKHLKKEHFIPLLCDRKPRTEWEAEGRKDVDKKAKEEAKRILVEHRPLELPASIKSKIEQQFPEIWD